ncbi:MAG: YbaB/EbfC family nucleoid-associated protein [Candidatus Sumerlaeia bacterium]|nr:YbaB/EbfC family nucleoid-associated protein [Candidatus Sumerlaeia bacterium]
MIDQNSVRKLQKELEGRMERIQDELKQKTVEGTAGGGAVTVVCNGQSEVISVSIKPEAVDPDDIEMLQDLVRAACNQAVERSKKMHEDAVSGLTGGLHFPGLF